MGVVINYDWLDNKLRDIENEIRAVNDFKRCSKCEQVVCLENVVEVVHDQINDLRNDLHLMKLKQQEQITNDKT